MASPGLVGPFEEEPRIRRGGLRYIYIYIYVYIYIYIYIYGTRCDPPPPPPPCLGEDWRASKDHTPYFKGGEHKQTPLRRFLDSWGGAFGHTKVWVGLKIGYDITKNRVLTSELKIANYARLAQKLVR